MLKSLGFSTDNIAYFKEIVSTPGKCGLDVETTIERRQKLCVVQVAHEDGRKCVIQVWGKESLLQQTLESIRQARCRFIAHNAIFETTVLGRKSVYVPVDCTMILAKVLLSEMRPDTRRQRWGLKDLVDLRLGKTVDKTEQKRDWRVPIDKAGYDYALEDAVLALELWVDLTKDITSRDLKAYQVIAEALPAITEANLTGCKLDLKAHKEFCRVMQIQADRLEIELNLICEDALTSHQSPAQISKWLIGQMFENPEIVPEGAAQMFHYVTGEYWPSTQRGLSLGKNIVARMLEYVELISPVASEYLRVRAEWMRLKKLLQAFGPNLRQMVDENGMVQGFFKPHGAWTSRMACADPNLQQMPNDPAFRIMFVARKGRKLVICDYGQIELRVGCLIADDKVMQEVFHNGADIHAATAEKIYRLNHFDSENPRHVALRKKAKAPNFAALYGAQAGAIALATGSSVEEAQALLDGWLEAYPGIAKYREEQPEIGRKQGYIEIVSGQRFVAVKGTKPAQFINSPVQGSAATVLYRALARVHRALKAAGIDAKIAMPVHDEIVLDCADEDTAEAAEILQREMIAALLEFFPEAAELGAATLAEASIGNSWGAKA